MALQITSISEIAGSGSTPPSASYFKLLPKLVAVCFWLYALANTFVFNLDTLIADALPTNFAWIWRFKFLIFLGGFAALLLLPNRLAVAKFCAYVAFYPFIFLLWHIPRLVMRLGS